MKLTRIVATRFGSLRDATLDGIGPGLTIVVGPNESGKSTFATLVRQVLYGFPGARQKDGGYKPDAGGREGRLSFSDGTGEWLIRRYEPPTSGTVEVQTLKGEQRGGELLGEIVGAVTQETYNVVFGFSLSEMAEIEFGKNEDVLAKLYAGSSGSQRNPIDARGVLEDEAGRLFKDRGKSSIAATLAARAEQKKYVTELERQARAYEAERARLMQLAEQLEPVRERRDTAAARLRRIESDAQQAEALRRQLKEARERAQQLERERDTQRAEASATRVNEALLAVGPEVSAVLDDAAAARQLIVQAKAQREQAAEHRRKAAALDAEGVTVDEAEARSRIEEWRTKRARLDAEAESLAAAAGKLRSRADSFADASRARQQTDRPTGRRPLVSGAVLLGLGLVFAVIGFFSDQAISVVVAAVMAVAGVLLMLSSRQADERGPDLSAEAVQLAAEADAAEREADAARERLSAATEEWGEWLARGGLASRGADPAAVAALLEDVRERSERLDRAESAEQEASRKEAEAARWNERLFALVSGPLGLIGVAADHDGAGLAARIRESLDTARAANDRKEAADRAAQAADRELADLLQRAEALRTELGEISERYELSQDRIDELQALISSAFEERAAADEQYEQLKSEYDQLHGKLEVQGRDDSLTRARQRIEGLTASLHADADAYLVERMAVALIDEARATYERDTQPRVVKTASEVFAAMTGGRYERVQVPLGEKRITAVTSGGEALTTSQLSRGTQEQLYLALRVGLIDSFGAQGPHLPVLMDDVVVNFDEERVAGAAGAIERLVASRQVLFFTCHERTAEALVQRVPDSTLVRLGRCPV